MTHPEGKYAWTVKVGEKGQFVIPKEARDIFGIKPGDTLIVLGDVERGIAIPPKETFTTGGTCFLRCQRRQVISSALFDAKKTSNSTCSFLFKKTSDSGGVFQ